MKSIGKTLRMEKSIKQGKEKQWGRILFQVSLLQDQITYFIGVMFSPPIPFRQSFHPGNNLVDFFLPFIKEQIWAAYPETRQTRRA